MLSAAQKEELLSTNYINKIDSNLTLVSEVRFPENTDDTGDNELVYLLLTIFFCAEKVTTMRFSLINYSYEDILYTTSNLKDNQYILKEVDDYLCGEIE